MRLSLDWLSEWISLPPDDSLVERLDMCGFEDTAIHAPGPDVSGLRVGRVLERAKHPNADRLSVCRVDVGADAPLEIVCGAGNVAAGQVVAVAVPGSRLPDGTEIREARIRGVASQGMICSARELGLGDDAQGILVLAADAPVGAPLSRVLRPADRVLEVGITPNRGDTASLLGVAREIRALFGGEIRLPEAVPAEAGPAARDAVRVAIEAPDACHRYAARVVRRVRVDASPAWLVRRLEASGLRSINNVVDATNCALLELGQPLHAFDLSAVRGREVRVRRARAGEKLTTLDGEIRELSAEDLVIADAERPIALAGVMGGADTQVTADTTEVLIESAHFLPAAVRASARRHGLRTEASYRFERGVDREGVRRAADRCARLLAEWAQGEVAPGAVEARGAMPEVTESIRLEVARANRLLGTELSPGEMRSLLERVGVTCAEPEPGVLLGRIPSHRNDLHLHQDLTEEVARIHGYDRIPTTEPVGVLRPVELAPARVLAERARDALAGAGLFETVSFPFLAAGDVEALRLSPDDPRRRQLRLVNPIREEEPFLRSSLLPTLLRLVRQNLGRQIDELAVFEVSRVFLSGPPGELPGEPLQVACALADAGVARLWGGPPAPLFHRARGVAERLLKQLGYVAILRRDGSPAYLHPGAGAAIEVGGRMVGAVGEIHPEVAAHFEIGAGCAVVEIDLSALLELPPAPARFREVSRFPQVRRDLAVIVAREVPAGEILEAARRAAGSDCVSAELFDRYEGRGVPVGRVSLAFRLVFQRLDRTLTDGEVTPAVDRVVRALAERFGAELRQSSQAHEGGAR
jgi:phenylalanyl-tRNA synthetase beta chain